ncbi:Rab effector MyRIP [Sarotherodon galilaeus]
MQPEGIIPVIRDKTEPSALRLGDVLKQTCVAREDARDIIAHETHNTDIVFDLYEGVLTAAIWSLGTEQAPIDVSEGSRPRLKRKKKASATIKYDKQRKHELSPQPLKPKIESTSYDFKNVGSDLKTETTFSDPTTWIIGKAERKSTGFTLQDSGRLNKKYIGVPSCIVRKVSSLYDRVMLVNLGSDSPLSRLYEMLTPDDDPHRDTPSQTASCHCAQFTSLAERYQVGVLVCWSPCGIYKLYGLDRMSEGVYIIVVESGN